MSVTTTANELTQVAYNTQKNVFSVVENDDFVTFHFPLETMKTECKDLVKKGVTYLDTKFVKRLVGIAKANHVEIDGVLVPKQFDIQGRILVQAAQSKKPVMVEFNEKQQSFEGISFAEGLVHCVWIGIFKNRLVQLETKEQPPEVARQIIFTEIKDIKVIY
ncbi:hypothetical protein [Enterovibrio norvegicus]|uniref:hypothetical protein n=1 Tax=Enterovibrio norvegicus TaxID=188144 RepID=UPI00352E4EBC